MTLVDPNYVDDGALRPQDQVDLNWFIQARDRALVGDGGVPFFSGREHEVSECREMINRLSSGIQSNATIVVEGPPGAGKSALLAQFHEEMMQLRPTESSPRQWLPVFLGAHLAESPKGIASAIDSAIATHLGSELLKGSSSRTPDLADRLQAAIGQNLSMEGLLDVARRLGERGGSAFGMSIGAKRHVPVTTLEDAVARRFDQWDEWQIVLLIDEAQQVSDEHEGDFKGTLSSIHQGGIGAPISFCAFGLTGTWDALEKVGVSRSLAGTDIQLATLHEADARKAVRRCFDAFDVCNGEAWEDAIVARSALWPQHLATYLTSAMSEIRDNAQDRSASSALDARNASLTAAIAQGDKGRRQFYARRLGRLTRDHARFQEYAETVSALFKEKGGPLSWQEVKSALVEGHDGIGDEDLDGFTEAARHAGLMQRTPSMKGYGVPIPSFAGFILSEPLPAVIEPEGLTKDATSANDDLASIP